MWFCLPVPQMSLTSGAFIGTFPSSTACCGLSFSAASRLLSTFVHRCYEQAWGRLCLSCEFMRAFCSPKTFSLISVFMAIPWIPNFSVTEGLIKLDLQIKLGITETFNFRFPKKLQSWCRDFPYSLHPAASDVNILHNRGASVRTRRSTSSVCVPVIRWGRGHYVR